MKAIYLGLIFLLAVPIQLNAQLCRDVEITTRVIRTIPDCNRTDGAIVCVNTRGGTEPYTYKLDTSTTQTGAFFNLGPNIYTVEIIDSRGCTATTTADLSYRELKDIIKPYNAFTPNGDDINETWIIPGIESFQSSEVNVYNKWGQQVHLNSPYNNEFGWDGTQNGSDLPSGTYFYVITVFNNCKEESLAGVVNIIR